MRRFAAPPTTLTPNQASRRVEQALMALGVSFADCLGLVAYAPDEETASFWRDPATGREAIRVGPRVAALEPPLIALVLRHELLHRALYHGAGERFPQHAVANLALDVCINRLLFEAWPDEMRALSFAIYPAESATTPVALANCVADPSCLPVALADLWRAIWQRRPDDDRPAPSPASLYFRLVKLRAAGVFVLADAESDVPPLGSLPNNVQRALEAVAAELRALLPPGAPLADEIKDFVVRPVGVSDRGLDAFAARIRARRVATGIAHCLRGEVERCVRRQCYPAWPDRLGTILRLTGLSAATGLYWNRDVTPAATALRVALYVDLSGSMVPRFDVVAGCARAFRGVPLRAFGFDTRVREIDLEALAAGHVRGGGGTDFDAVLRHFLGTDGLDAAVVFTDGEATVSAALGRALRASRRGLYAVYLGDTAAHSDLDAYATERFVVPDSTPGAG